MLRIKPTSNFQNQQSDPQHVPLKNVSVDAYVRGFAADVTIKQVFRNDENTSIEAVYCFPIEEQAAVYSFVARIDDREITAELKEKQQAQKEYSDALQQGHGAYLLEQDEKSQDNFIVNVGALPAGKECQISISYVTELNLIQNGSRIRFVVPTTIAPRYNPEKGGISSPGGTQSKYIQKAPYSITFRCQVDKLNVTGVSSPSHPVKIAFGNKDVYVIEFSQEKTQLDRDILLDIELEENHSNTIIAVESGALMASFTPSEKDCQKAAGNRELTNEFIFVVDCSGSMEHENKIELARAAMLLFLKSLPVNCHFNIIRFGSNYKTLFNEVTDIYNEKNAKMAEQLTNSMNADLGGTELLHPLQWLQEHPPKQSHARQIFLLTDGEISNVTEVLDLCRSMVTSARIFSFGLGNSPSRSLVKGLARATNGRFVFIPPKSNVDIYVGEQLQKALQPCITNLKVKWNLNVDIESAPLKMPPVYANDRLITYALVKDATFASHHDSSVELHTDKNQLIGMAKVDRIPQIAVDGTITRLAAKALILELQHTKLPSAYQPNNKVSLQTRFQHDPTPVVPPADEKEITKKRIIELSLQHKILSPYTAFVGIEKRLNSTNEDMVLREVPIQISADDQHLQLIQRVPPNMVVQSNLQYLTTSYISPNPIMCQPLCSVQAMTSFRNLAPQSSLSKMKYSKLAVNCNSSDLLFSDHNCSAQFGETVSPIAENEEKELWPTEGQDIVRYLIGKQKFDGAWDIDATTLENLTGKSIAQFPPTQTSQMLATGIIIIVFETRFQNLSSMWHGVIQKARKCLLDLCGNDTKEMELLLKNIRQYL